MTNETLICLASAIICMTLGTALEEKWLMGFGFGIFATLAANGLLTA